MDERKLAYCYALGVYTLAMIDAGSTIKLNETATIYSNIKKKHEVFLDQIRQYNKKKRDKLSPKATLFRNAVIAADRAWEVAMGASVGVVYSPDIVIFRMWYQHAELLKQIYGLDFDIIKKMHSKLPEVNGITFPSVRIGNLLTDSFGKSYDSMFPVVS